MQKGNKKRQLRKPQHQQRPGSERKLDPPPALAYPEKKGNNKLKGRIALISGADSGIGRAVAVLFAKEGADIAIAYLKEHKDARDTATIIKDHYDRQCLLIPGDLSNEKHCIAVIKKVINRYDHIDILVNNA